MTDNKRKTLPDEIAADCHDNAERDRVGELWSALASATPRAVVSADDREAMWAAIASATSSGDGEALSSASVEPAAVVADVPAKTIALMPARTRVRRWPIPLALAASLMLAVGALARPGAWEEIASPRAEVTRITLPDGSSVDLDAGSSLRFRRGFRGWGGTSRVREVALQGSAFFSVVRDGRPFAVQTYNASVRVLGTAFSVDARVGDSIGTSVAVTEGRVQLAGADAADAVVVSAGERSMVPHAARVPVQASAVVVERVAPWRSGGFVALDEPLGRVVRSLERRFDATILIPDTLVASRRVSLYYPARVPLERILSDLATTQTLRWERRVNGYVIE